MREVGRFSEILMCLVLLSVGVIWLLPVSPHAHITDTWVVFMIAVALWREHRAGRLSLDSLRAQLRRQPTDEDWAFLRLGALVVAVFLVVPVALTLLGF